jgi:hypothetical protein
MMSLPPMPLMVSLPPKPQITSLAAVPVIVLFPEVPTIVQVRPEVVLAFGAASAGFTTPSDKTAAARPTTNRFSAFEATLELMVAPNRRSRDKELFRGTLAFVLLKEHFCRLILG